MNFIFGSNFVSCDTRFNEPHVTPTDGSDLLGVLFVNNGNILLEKDDISKVSFGTNFNNRYNYIADSLGSVSGNGLMFQNQVGSNKILFGNDGRILTTGYAVYSGGQANCPTDGWINNKNNPDSSVRSGWYCNRDGITRESRDYTCQINGDVRSGDCEYVVGGTERCNQRNSVKPGGNSFTSKGFVKDYVSCERAGSNIDAGCKYDKHYDYCSGLSVIERVVSGAGVSSVSKNCDDYSGARYCSGYTWKETLWGCGNGACSDSSRADRTLDNCYFRSYYTCSGNSQTYHYPICSGSSGCGHGTSSSGCGSYISGWSSSCSCGRYATFSAHYSSNGCGGSRCASHSNARRPSSYYCGDCPPPPPPPESEEIPIME